MSTEKMEEIGREIVAQVVDAAGHGEARGLTPELSVCTIIGALKALVRALPPADCYRVARFVAFEFEMLAEGEPLPSAPRN